MKKPDHISPKAWAYAMELLKTAPQQWISSISAGTYIVPSGKPKEGEDEDYCEDYERGVCLAGTVCHAFIQYDSLFKRAEMYFSTTTSSDDFTTVDKKILVDWYRWMKEESPFQKFILNETVDSMVDGGVIIDLSHMDGNRLLFMCKMLRTPYEEPQRMEPWYRLYMKGVNGMLAWCYTQTHYQGDGRPMTSQTHCSHMLPATKDNIKMILSSDISLPAKKKDGKAKGRWTEGEWESADVFGGSWHGSILPAGNGMKKVKVPDGWGGFIMKEVPDEKGDLAAQLIEIQEKEK